MTDSYKGFTIEYRIAYTGGINAIAYRNGHRVYDAFGIDKDEARRRLINIIDYNDESDK